MFDYITLYLIIGIMIESVACYLIEGNGFENLSPDERRYYEEYRRDNPSWFMVAYFAGALTSFLVGVITWPYTLLLLFMEH